MKLFNKIIILSLFTTLFTGCLKDDSAIINPANTQNVIEFANTANLTSPTTSKYPLLSVNIIMQNTGTYNAVVSYSGANNAPEDITVEVVGADPAILTAYNTQNKTTYLPLPAANYSFPQTKVVIPRGQRQVNFPITLLNTDSLFGKNYVLGLSIKSASSGIISGNFNNILYLMTGINKNDGIYLLKYKFGANDRNYDVTPVTWYYSDVTLVTASKNTVTLRNLNAGTSVTTGTHAAQSLGIPTSIAGFVPLLTFDLASNAITLVSNNSGGAKTTNLDPSVTTSRFDPVSKSVFLSMILKEAGKADMVINDTLIFQTLR